jgi:hypothetical protein
MCDSVDNDCDGLVDAADLNDLVSYGLFRYDQPTCTGLQGPCAAVKKPARLCSAGGYWGNCDAAAYRSQFGSYQPNVESTCDGVDNDCNGDVDEDFSMVLLNGQSVVGVGTSCGTGNCQGGVTACRPDTNGTFCTTENNVTSERCDGNDNDCDGQSDEGFAFTTPDGAVVNEVGASCGTGACANGVAQCTPTGETMYCSTAALATLEICNGVDDDCDGLLDSSDPVDLAANDRPVCDKTIGACSGARRSPELCVGGHWTNCTAAEYEANNALYSDGTEDRCDGTDNDCDSATDEDFSVFADGHDIFGVGVACGSSACGSGHTTCRGDQLGTYCAGAQAPVAETCNNLDDNCDGRIDDGCDDDGDDYCRFGLTVSNNTACPLTAIGTGNDCDDDAEHVHPGAVETCDGVDTDCDGSNADSGSTSLCVEPYGSTSGSFACTGGNPTPDELYPYPGAEADGWECTVTSCPEGTSNLDTVDSTGCECAISDATAGVIDVSGSCGSAYNLGVLSDASGGSEKIVVGMLSSVDDVDLYRVSFVDSTGEPGLTNSFSARVVLTDDQSGAAEIRVTENTCAEDDTCVVASDNEYLWSTKGTKTGGGLLTCTEYAGVCPNPASGNTCGGDCCNAAAEQGLHGPDDNGDADQWNAYPDCEGCNVYVDGQPYCNHTEAPGHAEIVYSRTVYLAVRAKDGRIPGCLSYRIVLSNNKVPGGYGF